MRIFDDFVRDNPRVEIISNDGRPTPIPRTWRPILGDSDILVAIPDMHMFHYNSNLDNFKYGAESMLDFLVHCEIVQRQLFCEGRSLKLYQLGDLYELRFPNSLSNGRATSREIRRSHPLYAAIIRQMGVLNPCLIYGNHDWEHRHHPGFRESARNGQVYMEHGYSADRWYHFTNPELPGWNQVMTVFKTLRRVEASLADMRRAWLRLPEYRHVAYGVVSGELEISHYPEESTYPDRQISHFTSLLRRFRSHGNPARVCLVAHTHHPFIDPEFDDGRSIYIDAGAWTDGRSDFVVITNEEAAVCRYRRAASVEVALGYRTAV
ncbi:hypothetical protein GF420_03305 [candidate division GN15 bacterium]|nr:hypothetical protein [candidate division GN15 bacterium]